MATLSDRTAKPQSEVYLPDNPTAASVIRRWARRNPIGVVGLSMVVVLVAMALFADVLATHDPNRLVGTINQPISAEHYLGTDPVGRDIYSRLVYGARVSLTVGVVSVLIGVTTGALIGLLSGYRGGAFDMLVQRFVDANIAIPGIVLALVMIAVLGPSMMNLIIALAIGDIALATRVTRSVVLREKQKVYVDAARAIGARSNRVMFRHVLPNSISPYLVLVSVSIAGAIIGEASLSFLGAGVGPNTPSWGSMLSEAAARYFDASPALALAPGLAISAAVLGFNLFGDAMRDTLDPRLRGR